jgi:hypothetical protein
MTVTWDGVDCSFVVEDDITGGVIYLKGFVDYIVGEGVPTLDCVNTEEDGDTTVTLCFVTEPDAGEKTTVETAISSYTYVAKETKFSDSVIFKNIYNSVADQAQLDRLIAALDLYPSFSIALKCGNYTLATERADLALSNADIIQADHDLIVSKFPGA